MHMKCSRETAMHRVIAILVSSCMVYSKQLDPYKISQPIEYFAQEHDYVYHSRPPSDKSAYSDSYVRTDANYESETNAPEAIGAIEIDIPSNYTTNPDPREFLGSTKEPDLASPTPPLLPLQEVKIYLNQNIGSSSEASFNAPPIYSSSNISPLNIFQKGPQVQPVDEDDNEYPSNSVSALSNVYQDQTKYSDTYKSKYSNYESLPAKNYQEESSVSGNYKSKYSNDVLPPPKSYKEKPKYSDNYKNKYSNYESLPAKNDQEESSFSGNYKSKYWSYVLPPLKGYKERPKYFDNYKSKYSNNGTPPSKSYQGRPKYSSNYKYIKNEAPSKSYQERPKYYDDAEYASSNLPSKTYQKLSKYPKEFPYYISLTPEHQETPKYKIIFEYPSKSSQNKYNEQLQYEDLTRLIYESPSNDKSPSQKKYTSTTTKQEPKYILSRELSSEEKPKYLSETESRPENTDQELLKHPSAKKVMLSSSTSQEPDDYDYHDLPPPPPNYLAQHYYDEDSMESWHVPPFVQSLKDLDRAESLVLSLIFGKGSNHDKKLFTVIAGALDGMIKTMTHTSWNNYEKLYETKIPKLFKYTEISRHIASAQLKCVYDWINQNVEKVRNIISNNWINHICRTSDVSCDSLILAAIDASNDRDTQNEAQVLLAVGKAAGLFLNKYARTLKQQVSANGSSTLSSFMLKSMEYFKPLIKASSDARRMIPTSSYKCFDAPVTGY